MNVRSDFPIFSTYPDLHYLDSAATTQKPQAVLDALVEFYSTANANPHRGAYALSVLATDVYHAARNRIARFLGVADPACLIFTRGTTEGLNLVAQTWGRKSIQAGDEILVTALEHHANFVPWQQIAIEKGAKLRICELNRDATVDLDSLASLLNAKTKLVAFNHVSNAIGAINDVSAIAALVRARCDAVLVCDGAQSAPHMRVNFDSLGVDFYAFSGHKMCGPMGIGGLLGKRALFESMPPYQTGGDMIEFVHDDRATWNILPHKFEAGTPNAANAVGLAAAVDYLDAIGMDKVLEHERKTTLDAHERLSAIEGVHIYGPPPAQRSGVVSFTIKDVHPHDLATVLDSDGVCIRAGHHCAQPLMRRLGIPATARASFYIYNDSRDTDALIEGVHKAREIFANVSF